MWKIRTVLDLLRSACSAALSISLRRTTRRGSVLQVMLGLAVVWLFACDSLWSQFQGPNPINCVLNPDNCTEGQVCNVQTRLCESQNTQPMNPAAALSLLAGSLGG